MKWLNARWQELTGRYKKGFFLWIVCVFLFGISILCTWLVTKNLYDQQAADRWSKETEYAQISCFYPVSMALSEFDFLSLHHKVEDALKAESMEAASEGAKLFVDAYSVSGKLTMFTESQQMEVTAVGVSDEFFLFHPLELLSGAYFDENMIMKDGVILDETAAFRLYGSNDVVGMPIYIGNSPYYIRGVVALDDGYFAKKAGLSTSVCFVAVETLEKHGQIEGSYTYEVVMPNAVDGFAKGIVENALNDTNQQIEVVENSARFTFDKKKEVVMDFGVRSMSRNSIIYPYWENIARATEDVCGILFVLQMISLGIIVILSIWYVRKVYEKKGNSTDRDIGSVNTWRM